MRTCEACGFDNAVDGRPCPLCGAATSVGKLDEVPTLNVGDGVTPGGKHLPSLPPGFLYAGRFLVEKLLGRGGMGTVYEVLDTTDGRTLALKTLTFSGDDDSAERFRREIEMLSRIRHPGVPRIHGWGKNPIEGDVELFFVSDYIRGRDLRAHLADHGSVPVAEACRIGAEIADALAAAHAIGIVHRDVKPQNVMVAEDASIRLLDFGVARGTGLDLKTITKTGMIVGTPEYMSPEQLDSHRVDERSDLYSLGVVLFELVAGRRPFEAETPVAVAMKHLRDEPPPLRTMKSGIPAWYERIVERSLQKSPGKRWPSAADLAAELRKTRVEAAPRKRKLPNGDFLITDEAGTTDWALVVATPKKQPEWSTGALRFEERYYKLAAEDPPGSDKTAPERWFYRFVIWPEQEVFRRVVDYVPDQKPPEPESGGMLGGLKKWLPK